MTKLSELLAWSVNAIQECADNASFSNERTQYQRDRDTLRAIAPALVEAMKAAVGRHIEIEDHNALCSACRFARILSEAGVTCE